MSSLLNIKNKKDRDIAISEYLAVKQRLKKRDLARRMGQAEYQKHLEESYEPVMKANKVMAEAITDELKPIRKEISDLSRTLTARPKAAANRRQMSTGVKRKFESMSDDESSSDQDEDSRDSPHSRSDVIHSSHSSHTRHSSHSSSEDEEWEPPYPLGPLSEKFLDMYKDEKTRKSKLDTTFGLRKEGDTWMIGSQPVTVGPDDSIQVGDVTFPGSSGFWSLVTYKQPRHYTGEDLSRYKELLYETDALYDEYDRCTGYPRSSGSTKWGTILGKIWREFRKEGIVVQADDLDQSGYDADTSMYLHKDGLSYDLKKTRDGSMHISPRPNLTGVHGDGLYLRRRGSGLVHRGEGLIFGPDSPFKSIPILNLLL